NGPWENSEKSTRDHDAPPHISALHCPRPPIDPHLSKQQAAFAGGLLCTLACDPGSSSRQPSTKTNCEAAPFLHARPCTQGLRPNASCADSAFFRVPGPAPAPPFPRVRAGEIVRKTPVASGGLRLAPRALSQPERLCHAHRARLDDQGPLDGFAHGDDPRGA